MRPGLLPWKEHFYRPTGRRNIDVQEDDRHNSFSHHSILELAEEEEDKLVTPFCV